MIGLLAPLSILSVCLSVGHSFYIGTLPSENSVSATLKYNGKGFTAELQEKLNEALSDSIIFYKDEYFSQANYILKQLNGVQEGLWHVVIVKEINISKVTDISTGFYYFDENETWALWYEASQYGK